MDVTTNRRVVDWDRINGEKARVAALPGWRRFLHLFF